MIARIRGPRPDAGLRIPPETFIGGKETNKHESKKLKQGRGAVGKAVDMGILDRETKQVRTNHIEKTSPKIMKQEVRDAVEAGSELNTDTCTAYKDL